MLRKIIFIFVAPCFGYAANEIFFQLMSLFNPTNRVWLPGVVIPGIVGGAVTAIFMYYGFKKDISDSFVKHINTIPKLIFLGVLGLGSFLIATEYKNRNSQNQKQVEGSEAIIKLKINKIFEQWTQKDSTNNIARFGNSAEYKSLSYKEKLIFFENYVAKDSNYITANQETKKAIRDKFGIN